MKVLVNFVVLSSLFCSSLVFAAPVGGQVVAGTARITQNGANTMVDQTTSSAVINWKGFDTARNEAVNFHQPNANSVTLNRITSGLPTNFAGSLFANGKVLIVNPAGMVFAKNSVINAASILATTADIKDADFMQGNYKFFAQPGFENARIINNGSITVQQQGFVAVIAPNAVNTRSGIIEAEYGRVVLASGKTFVLDFNNDGLINFDVNSAVKNSFVENAGKITANGGKVFLTANTISQVLDNVISMSGVIEASSANDGDGSGVVLNGNGGSVNISGTLNVANMGIKTESMISQTDSSAIYAETLSTASGTGTNLGSHNNSVFNFSAVNTGRGDIYYHNNGVLHILGITQLGDNLTVVNTYFIEQDADPAHRIKVSGSSIFTALNTDYGAVSLWGDNQFTGPVTCNGGQCKLPPQ